jgi:hypothetical protein
MHGKLAFHQSTFHETGWSRATCGNVSSAQQVTRAWSAHRGRARPSSAAAIVTIGGMTFISPWSPLGVLHARSPGERRCSGLGIPDGGTDSWTASCPSLLERWWESARVMERGRSLALLSKTSILSAGSPRAVCVPWFAHHVTVGDTRHGGTARWPLGSPDSEAGGASAAIPAGRSPASKSAHFSGRSGPRRCYVTAVANVRRVLRNGATRGGAGVLPPRLAAVRVRVDP